MFVNKEIINDYKDHGVALIRNIISNQWLEKYNYKEPEVRAKKQSGNKSRSNVDRFLNSR